MPRKKNKPEIKMDPLRHEFVQQATTLWEEFQDRMVDIIERSETQKLGVGFHVTIDNSEANIKVSTRIKFGENYTDEKVSQLDIDQGKFEEVLEDAKAKSKSKRNAESVDGEA